MTITVQMKPMLAHKFDEARIDFKDFTYMQPKLDGVRCLFTKDGAFSRTGKQFMNVRHIEESLKDYFEQNPAMVLDGELYNHDLKDDFEKIISLVRKQKPTDEERLDASKLTPESFTTLTNFPNIVQDSGQQPHEISRYVTMELGMFKVKIKKINDTSEDLIKCHLI